MKILALETSGVAGSVALLEGDGLAAEKTVADEQRSAAGLAPAMNAALQEAGWQPADVDLVAVTAGPGSFTGLRVGVTTAKTFAYAAGCDVLAVNTLHVIANQAPGELHTIESVIDAYRGQLFAARFARSGDGALSVVQPTRIVDIDEWIAALPAEAVVAGPGVKKVAPRLPDNIAFVDERWSAPRALAVGQIAYTRYQAGDRDDLWKLAPDYFRKSAAEEKWEQQQAK